MIDRIEVILGPGSVLYGSNAMLGVINIVTKPAKDFAGLRGAVESEIPTSIRGMAGFGREFRLLGVQGGVTVGLEYFASRGPASGFGPQNYGLDAITGKPKIFSSQQGPTGIWTSKGNPDLFFDQVPSAYARLVLGGFELSLRGALYKRWSPFGGGADLAGTSGYELDRWLSIDARYRATAGRLVRLSARLYGDIYDYRERDPAPAAEDCLAGQTNGCVYDLAGKSRWAGAEVTSTFDWLKDGTVATLIGVDGRVRYTEGSSGDYIDAITGKATASGPTYGAAEKAFAAFLEQTARPTRWLDLNAGARLDVDERFGFHVSPRVAVVASPWRGGHFKAIYAEAFRAPSAYERYFHDPKFQVVADTLRAEAVRSVEGSFEQRVGGQRLLATVFHSWWSDMVFDAYLGDADIAAAKQRGQLDPTASYAYQYRNTAGVRSFGGSVLYEGVVLAQRLRYALAVTGAYARQDDGDGTPAHPLVAAAQLFGNARVSYDLGAPFPVIALAGRFAGRRPISGTSFTPVPTVSPLVELRATVSGPFPKLRGLSYRLSANGLVAEGGPYAIGPLRDASPGYTKQEVVPLDHFRVTAGLEYVLPL
jgi:outer membrane receptor protein involved in Fe transport